MLTRQLCIQSIRDQHVSRFVSDANRWLSMLDNDLGRDPARPEHWHFVFVYDGRHPGVRLGNIVDADHRRVSEMDWCSVDARVPCGNFDCSDCI